MPVPTYFITGSRTVHAVRGNKNDYGRNDLWKRWVLSLEWKVEGVIEMVRAKVVTAIRWYAQHEVNQEDREQNEVDGMKKGDTEFTSPDWGSSACCRGLFADLFVLL